MTRKEILKNYKVDGNGIILDTGKFNREPLYVAYLWCLVEQGLSAQCKNSPGYETVSIDKEDWEEFPELEGFVEATLLEDPEGDVWLKDLSEVSTAKG